MALASSTETAVGDNNSLLGNVSTVINQDTTLDSAPLKVPQQQRHSELPRNRHQTHSDDPIISTKTTVNEVEYNFDIDINYEVKSGKNLVNVKGSLKNHCQFWKNVLNASDYILNVIALGYRIPFVSEPTSVMLRNNLSSNTFVERAISELLILNNCINEVTCPPFVVNPLTVSVNSSGKERFVLDLRHVNKFVDKQKVKFEGVNEALAFANNSKVHVACINLILNQVIII